MRARAEWQRKIFTLASDYIDARRKPDVKNKPTPTVQFRLNPLASLNAAIEYDQTGRKRTMRESLEEDDPDWDHDISLWLKWFRFSETRHDPSLPRF